MEDYVRQWHVYVLGLHTALFHGQGQIISEAHLSAAFLTTRLLCVLVYAACPATQTDVCFRKSLLAFSVHRYVQKLVLFRFETRLQYGSAL